MMDFWDKEYSRDLYVYGHEANVFLQKDLHLLQKGRVLNLGDGEGRNSVFLAQHGFEVTSLDSSAVGLAKAQKLAEENQVSIHTVCQDLNDFKAVESHYDVITLIFCHLPSSLLEKVIKESIKSLKPGGYLLWVGYDKSQLAYQTGGPKNPDFLPSKDDLLQLSSGINWLIADNETVDLQEGVNHRGISSVVHLLGTKK